MQIRLPILAPLGNNEGPIGGTGIKKAKVVPEAAPLDPPLDCGFCEVIENVRRQFHVAVLAVEVEDL